MPSNPSLLSPRGHFAAFALTVFLASLAACGGVGDGGDLLPDGSERECEVQSTCSAKDSYCGEKRRPICVAHSCECSDGVVMGNLTSSRVGAQALKAETFRIWVVESLLVDGSRLRCEDLIRERGAAFSARADINIVESKCDKRQGKGDTSQTQVHLSSNSLVYIEFYADQERCSEDYSSPKYLGCTAVGTVEEDERVSIELVSPSP